MQTHGVGIGQTLRKARERRRLSLDTISRATMIRRDYLELIDDDHLEALPPGAYAMGFIRAYATYVGLDPRPLIQTYERLCGEPARERPVVRQPLRVPNPAHPHSWRLAAGAGVAALVLLGVLGVLRSSDNTARAPSTRDLAESAMAVAAAPPPTAAASEVAVPPSANPAGAVVRVEVVKGTTWIDAHEDGKLVFSGRYKQGEGRMFRGDDTVTLVIENPAAVRITANGNRLQSPPGPTYRGTFTPTTTTLPPSQPR